MSKRSFRRLAVVAGAALAIGSMAPAMAVRVDADAEVDTDAVITDVVNITDALPIPAVPALPALPALPSITQVNGTILTTGVLANGLLGTGFGGLNTLLGTAVGGLGLLGGDCGLVAVASCNATPLVNAQVPVNAALPVNAAGILQGGILNNTGDLGLGVLAPITANVAAPVVATVGGILGGDLLGGDLLGGLGGLLDVSAEGNVNVLAGLLGSL